MNTLTYVFKPTVCSVLVGGLVLSCTKEGDDFLADSSNDGLSSKNHSFTAIGEEHNAVLEYAILQVDFENDPNPVLTALNAIRNLNYDFSQSTLDLDGFMNLSPDIYNLGDSLEYDLSKWSDNPYSQQATVILQSTLDLFQDDRSFNLIGEVYSEIEVLREDAINNLSGDELNAVLNSLGIAESSAYFWAPVSIGGRGYWEHCNEHKAWSWGNAVLGDAVASMGYWSAVGAVGVVAASVPPSNAAIFTGWAVSAAVGSVMGGIR